MKLKRNTFEEDELEDEAEIEDPTDLEDDEDLSAEDSDLLGDDSNEDYYGDDLYGGGGTPPLKKHEDLLKDLTNFDPFLKKVFNSWLGITWNEEKEKFTRNPLLNPMMNIKCAAWCNNFLQTYARGNNIITYLGKEDYEAIQEDMINNIYCNIWTRAEEFGIKQDGDLIMISDQLIHSAMLILMGAGEGKYNKFLGTTYSQHANLNQAQPNNININPNGMPMAQPKPMGMIDSVKKRFGM